MSGYVAVFGSHTGDWRVRAHAELRAAGLQVGDPRDPRWRGLTRRNGDRHQGLIDRLVANQHALLLGAACVLFHLGSTWTDEAGHRRRSPAYAARTEIGFLTGRGIPTFVHIEPDLTGRNYLWAQLRLYPHMRSCATLEDACAAVVTFMRANGA